MDNLSFFELFESTMKWNPRNSTHVIPGTYDVKLVDAVWIITTALFIFTIQTGYSMVIAGILSKKNHINVILGNIIDVCFGGLTFWAVGFGLAYGRGEYTNPFIGLGDFFVNPHVDDPLMPQILIFFFMQSSFATTSASIFSAAIAERVKITAYILLSIGITFIYAIAAGWVWGEHGFLRNMGVLDFGGAGPIHVTGGAAALVGAWYIGPRIGRFNKGTKPAPLKDPMMACIGMLILWWGWFGFNAGSSYGMTEGKLELAARAGAGTLLATIGASCTSFTISKAKHHGKLNVADVLFSIMSSLVAINAGCFVFSSFGCLMTGSICAILYMFVAPIIDSLHIDDASASFAIHWINGAWGEISIGFFADPAIGPKSLTIDGSLFRLKVQTFSVLCITLWTLISSYVLIKFVDLTIGIRLSEEEEIAGYDPSQLNLPSGKVSNHPTTVISTISHKKIDDSDALSYYNIVSTPLQQKYKMNSALYKENFDDLNHPQNGHVNEAYERD